jgi:hypothetical protein
VFRNVPQIFAETPKVFRNDFQIFVTTPKYFVTIPTPLGKRNRQKIYELYVLTHRPGFSGFFSGLENEVAKLKRA